MMPRKPMQRTRYVMGACVLASIAALAPGDAVAEQRAPKKRPAIGKDSDKGDKARQKQARELYKEAEKLFLGSEYEKALELYQESYRLSGRSAILIAIANTYERLGRYETASETFRRYLATAPESEKPAIRERIRVLDERAAQARAAKPEPAEEPVEEREPPTPAQPEPAPPQPVLVMSETPKKADRPLAGWVLVGTGAAALVTGATFAGLVYQARQSADCQDNPRSGTDIGEDTYLCSVDSKGALDRERSFSVVADISLGVGAAALLAGITVFLLHDPKSSEERVSLSIHPTGAALTWRY